MWVSRGILIWVNLFSVSYFFFVLFFYLKHSFPNKIDSQVQLLMIQNASSPKIRIIEFEIPKDPKLQRLSCLTPLFFIRNYLSLRRLKPEICAVINEIRLGFPNSPCKSFTALQFQYLNIQKTCEMPKCVQGRTFTAHVISSVLFLVVNMKYIKTLRINNGSREGNAILKRRRE